MLLLCSLKSKFKFVKLIHFYDYFNIFAHRGTIVHVQTSKAMKTHSPKQTPVPIIGGFVIHLSGNSHVPENPPGPPHASPSILAHTLQHLD